MSWTFSSVNNNNIFYYLDEDQWYSSLFPHEEIDVESKEIDYPEDENGSMEYQTEHFIPLEVLWIPPPKKINFLKKKIFIPAKNIICKEICPICTEKVCCKETHCKHKYCKNCLSKIKNMPNPRCAFCRDSLIKIF